MKKTKKFLLTALICLTAIFGAIGFSSCEFLNKTILWKNNGVLYYSFNVYTKSYSVVGVRDESILEIIIPSSFKGNPVTSIGYHAFSECKNLKSIVIPGSIQSIFGYSFEGCKNFETVVIGNGVVSIENKAFENCDSLTSVIIPNSVQSIGNMAFGNCDSLTSVVIPDSVQSIGNMAFWDCNSLTSVEIGDSVQSIGRYAFADCDNLISVKIGEKVQSIGDSAFLGCTNLTNIYITDIAAWCNIDFYDITSNPLCYAENLYLNGELVTELVIPDDITQIKPYAFSGGASLTSVEIPDSVEFIGRYAFAACDKLTSISFKDTSTWYRTDSKTNWENKTGGTQTDVTKSDDNAEYFKDTYYDYYWYKL